MTAPTIDSPWLVGWAEIGAYVRMHPRTVARKARIRRACRFVDRRPRIRREQLDALIEKAKP